MRTVLFFAFYLIVFVAVPAYGVNLLLQGLFS